MPKRPYVRKEFGEIDGITVYGQYYDEDGAPSVVVMTWNGWQIETDGTWLWLPTTGDSVGNMRVSDWQRIKELAQTDVIERLIAMGQEWAKTPPLKASR